LLNLVFTKHPKSGDAWAHRRWVLASLGTFGNSESTPSPDALAFIRAHARGELSVCARMSEIYPKNYYSWTHRAWVLRHATNDVLLEELESMDRWTRRNVSDFCGFHHTQVVLLMLIERNARESDEICSIWREHFKKTDSLIQTYPGHEALWCHKRALVFFFCSVVSPKLSTKLEDLRALIATEVEFSDSRIGDDGESHHEQQRLFALRYKAFLLDVVAHLVEKFPPEQQKAHFEAVHKCFADVCFHDSMHAEMWRYKLTQIEKLIT